MAKTEQDHVKPAASGQLVGKGSMTEAEKATSLQQARKAEAEYSSKDYVRDNDPQHKFHDPDHPVNLKSKIENGLARVEMLRENINAQLDSPFISFRLQESLKAYAATHTTLARNQSVLESRLESRNGATNQPASVAASTEAAAVKQDESKSSKWYRQPTSDPYAQSISDAIAHRSAGSASVVNPPVLKPYVAQDNPSALIDDKAVSKPIRSLYDHAATDPHNTPISSDQIKRASKYAMAAMGLFAAGEAAANTEGPIPGKLKAAGEVLKDQVVDAIPGVTYAKKMAAGKYEDARLDAAGYLPLGDAAGSVRSSGAQAIIDALPKNKTELAQIQQDKTQAPINRHLAEYQLAFVEAKDKGDVSKGLMVSSHLTDLAERKLVLQTEWKQSADHFITALKDPQTDWEKLAKNSDIAPQAAIHLAAVNSHYPAAFVEKMDATLASNLAKGTPVSPEMMAITKAAQASETQPQVGTAELAMAH